MIFRFFENIATPFPVRDPKAPPRGFWAFVWHYARPFRWLFLVSILVSASLAFLEVFLFETIGSLVDWVMSAEPDRFIEQEGWRLGALAVLVVVRGRRPDYSVFAAQHAAQYTVWAEFVVSRLLLRCGRRRRARLATRQSRK